MEQGSPPSQLLGQAFRGDVHVVHPFKGVEEGSWRRPGVLGSGVLALVLLCAAVEGAAYPWQHSPSPTCSLPSLGPRLHAAWAPHPEGQRCVRELRRGGQDHRQALFLEEHGTWHIMPAQHMAASRRNVLSPCHCWAKSTFWWNWMLICSCKVMERGAEWTVVLWLRCVGALLELGCAVSAWQEMLPLLLHLVRGGMPEAGA